MKRLWPKLILLLVAITAAANVAAVLSAELHPDEAFCWVWSRQLELCYYDHAPIVAYLVRLSTAIGGDGVFWVRLPALIMWGIFLLAVYLTARRIYRSRSAGYLGVLFSLFVPMLTAGSQIITPDIPMVVFSVLTWYFLYQAIEEENHRAWYWVGLFFGLALDSKYQAALIAPAAFLMLLIRGSKRHILKRKEPYLAVLISLALFTPLLYWSWRHQWANLLFQFGKGVRDNLGLASVLEFLAGQIGAFSPLFIFLILYALKRLAAWRRILGGDAFLIGGFLPIFGFFALTSLTAAAAPNWPSAAYFPALVFLAGQGDRLRQSPKSPGKSLAIGGIALSLAVGFLLITVARYPGFYRQSLGIKLPSSVVLSNSHYGWSLVGRKVDAILKRDFPSGKPVPLFSDEYMVAAELDYYVKSPKTVFTTREAARDMYDYYLIQKIRRFKDQGGLLVLYWSLPNSAGRYFSGIESIGQIDIKRFGRILRSIKIYKFDRLDAEALYEMALHKPIGYPGRY